MLRTRPFWMALVAIVLLTTAASASQYAQLTNTPATDRHPTWTTDGQSVIFESNRSGPFRLYRVPASGGPAVQISFGPGDDRFPEVSPDGNWIAFTQSSFDSSGHEFGNVWILPAAGGPPQQVSTSTHPLDLDWHPAWAPNSQQVYFSRRHGDNFTDFDIYTAPVGGATVPFHAAPGLQNRPHVSRSGQKVAFESNFGTSGDPLNVAEVSVASPNDVTQLTFESQNTVPLDYYPGDTKLLFASRKIQGDLELFERAFPSGIQTRITFDAENSGFDPYNSDGMYSPDGTRIAFTSRRLSGDENIWVLDTSAPSNQPPFAPSNPSPTDGQLDVPFDSVTLSWTGGDPDDDPVTYNVRVATSNPPPGPGTTVSTTQFNAGPLQPFTNYYWQVTASDGSHSTPGPVWSFRTAELVRPPVDLTQITDTPAIDRHPTWTADGQHIVFESDRTGEFRLWRVPSNGGVAEQISFGPGDDRFPEISPDGTWIAFTRSFRDAANHEYGNVWVMPTAGGDPERLSKSDHPLEIDWHPAWTPDSKRVYFARRHGDNFQDFDIYSARLGVGPTTAFHVAPGLQSRPHVSRDGLKVVFENSLSGALNVTEVPISDPNSVTQLTFESRNTVPLDYFLDGTKLLIASRKIEGDLELFEIDLPSLTTTRLTFDAEWSDFDPYNSDGMYSPDGTKIALTSKRLTGEENIWVLNLGPAPYLPARVFFQGAEGTIRLGSGAPDTYVEIEPLGGSFSALDALLGSIRMVRSGTGTQGQIYADPVKSAVGADRDHNGVAEIHACFKKEDIRILFGDIMGTETVHVTLEGGVSSGGIFRAGTDLIVVGAHMNAAVHEGISGTIYPNPFNPEAVLRFSTHEPGFARVTIFDASGRLTGTLLDEAILPAGTHEVPIGRVDGRGRSLSSGGYFYLIEAHEGRFSGRFTVLK